MKSSNFLCIMLYSLMSSTAWGSPWHTSYSCHRMYCGILITLLFDYSLCRLLKNLRWNWEAWNTSIHPLHEEKIRTNTISNKNNVTDRTQSNIKILDITTTSVFFSKLIPPQSLSKHIQICISLSQCSNIYRRNFDSSGKSTDFYCFSIWF